MEPTTFFHTPRQEEEAEELEIDPEASVSVESKLPMPKTDLDWTELDWGPSPCFGLGRLWASMIPMTSFTVMMTWAAREIFEHLWGIRCLWLEASHLDSVLYRSHKWALQERCTAKRRLGCKSGAV